MFLIGASCLNRRGNNMDKARKQTDKRLKTLENKIRKAYRDADERTATEAWNRRENV